MKLDQYFNGVALGIMATALLAGIPLFVTAVRPREPGVSRTSEPAYSTGLALIYLAAIYAIGGGLGALVKSSNAVVNGSLLLLCAVLVHCHHLIRRWRRPAVDVVQLSAGPDPAVGITALFDSGKSDELRASCRKDCERATRARLVAPDLKELFSREFSLGEVLSEALRKGLRIEALTDGRVTDVADLGLPSFSGSLDIVGHDTVNASGHWLILELGGAVYFGLGGDGITVNNMPICRGITSEDAQSGRVVRAVISVLDSLFDRARKNEYYSRVATSSSPKTYRERIVPAEAGANTIDRIPKRLSVVFKGEATVRSIAEQRFGSGSSSVEHYVREHGDRRQEFFGALSRGMVCREIYNEDELLWYVKSREHSAAVTLSRSEIADTVMRWRQAIEMHTSYLVALTTDPIPFKYELIDGRLMALHEAIGVADSHRLNAIFIEGRSVGEDFLADFNTIWERVSPNKRSKTELLRFVDNMLVPLLREPEGIGESNGSGTLGEVPPFGTNLPGVQ
jgi:hypothetical protein